MDLDGRNYVRDRMPIIGFGTYQIKDYRIIYNVIDAALAAGYRLFDTAQGYRNEKFIGNAFRELLPKYDLQREDIFVISKLDPSNHGTQKAGKSIEQSLKNLGFEYLDLFLIHWPGVRNKDVKDPLNAKLRHESWKVLENHYASGMLKAIGVSNYMKSHLEQLFQDAVVLPALNQCEFHPHCQQTELIDYCQKQGIIFQAYSSFGSPGGKQNLFDDPKIAEVAHDYKCSIPQFLLSWAISQGICVLPRSTNCDHVLENFKSLEVKIAEEDIKKVIDQNSRKYCWDPSIVE